MDTSLTQPIFIFQRTKGKFITIFSSHKLHPPFRSHTSHKHFTVQRGHPMLNKCTPCVVTSDLRPRSARSKIIHQHIMFWPTSLKVMAPRAIRCKTTDLQTAFTHGTLSTSANRLHCTQISPKHSIFIQSRHTTQQLKHVSVHTWVTSNYLTHLGWSEILDQMARSQVHNHWTATEAAAPQ